MNRSELFGALRERRFRLLWLGQATSTLGDGLVPVALAFAVIQTLDGSPTDLGIVLAAQTLPLVVYATFQAGELDASIAAAAILVLAALGVLIAVRAFHWRGALDVRGVG